jgi:UDP-N-acetylglucosamine 2-epimerase (hydrolysing)
MKKKIVFISGTRADFGKMKSLMLLTQKEKNIKMDVFVTGMHLQKKYGYTINEIKNSNILNLIKYKNFKFLDTMDEILSKTISGFSSYIKQHKPDLIVVHGDRVEALAGAICGAINNILVAHIEGGEVSGTIDDSIRHAVSKFSHIHLVTDTNSKKRLIQLGENKSNIFILGSPDLDLMKNPLMPKIADAKRHYNIEFDKYSIVLFHPVTSEVHNLDFNTKELCKSLIKSKGNYVVIYPNNDHGSDLILERYKELKGKENFLLFPSIRFEYFLTLLKNSEFIIGNSSCGLREAPYFNIPTINIGSRQNNRAILKSVINCNYESKEILNSINLISKKPLKNKFNQKRTINSGKKFIEIIRGRKIWNISPQKVFNDIKF